jgi:micrococcal nuclease
MGTKAIALALGLLVVCTACVSASHPMAEEARLVEGTVNRVIDGDTLDARVREARTVVGYLGAHAPLANEACGPEAFERNRELVGGFVLLEEDPAYEFDDRGRRLYYVYTPEGTFIDEVLVREGLARAANPDGRYAQSLAEAEAQAHADGTGCLWASQ